MKLILSLLIALVFINPTAKAQGIPVYDNASLLQTVTQLKQMAEDYQKQIEQLDESIKQTGAITGTRNMGSFANGQLEAELRRYLPNTWQDTMNMINAGNTSGIYSDLYNTYHPITGAEFMTSDPNGAIATALDRKTGTTYAAMAASEQAYNNIEKSVVRYEAMLSELNNTDDLKASIDLQARIAVENGLVLNELMRLKTIEIQQQAASDNQSLTNQRRASVANKYDADKANDAFKIKD